MSQVNFWGEWVVFGKENFHPGKHLGDHCPAEGASEHSA